MGDDPAYFDVGFRPALFLASLALQTGIGLAWAGRGPRWRRETDEACATALLYLGFATILMAFGSLAGVALLASACPFMLFRQFLFWSAPTREREEAPPPLGVFGLILAVFGPISALGMVAVSLL